MNSIAGSDDRRDVARRVTRRPRICRKKSSYYSSALDDYGTWDYERDRTAPVWYPRVAADWRPYSQGRWSYTGVLRLGLGRHRPLVLADASLRTLGRLVEPLVLDSGPPLGTGVGRVGPAAGLRRVGARSATTDVPVVRLRRPDVAYYGDPWRAWTTCRPVD